MEHAFAAGLTPAEQLVLAAMLLGSIAAFGFRLRPILHNILRARKDADFRLRPLAPRVRRLWAEVLLQAKVIRGRPLPGIAHAAVFWGFCAFAPATCQHLLAGFHLRLMDPEGALARGYFALVAGIAIAVAAAILGLAVRRFLLRPKWLGPVSPESGAIAFLIFFLMATFLADYAAALPDGWGWINWWAHTLALLIFLPLIPRTKHFHLALSPLTLFLSRGVFSAIPPLAGDEELGLISGRDVSRLTALQAYTCVECGRCTEHCPAYNTGKALNPKEIVLGFRRYLNQHGPAAEMPLFGSHLSQEAVFQCTTCGACEHHCPVGVEHLPMIVGLRRGAVNTGAWEDEHGVNLFLNLERTGNPLGLSAFERQKFITRSRLPYFDGSQEYVLWLGCMGAYDPAARRIIEALARVLRFLGVSFGVLKVEKCTGDAARRLGNDLLFQQLAESNIEALRKAGARKLLSICPHCVRTIAEDWREFKAEFSVEHHSEFLAQNLDRLPASSRSAKVVFHDPCYLGRYRGVYEAPRRVLRRAGILVEASRSRERSFCCGAGGGLAFLGEEAGSRINQVRLKELASAGADVVAAACPFCHTMFRDALGADSGAAVRLADIAQVAASGLPGGEEEKM